MSEWFRDLRYAVRSLLHPCDRIDIEQGDILLSPGNSNENVYIVLSGRLHVHIGSTDAQILATMDVGACVG